MKKKTKRMSVFYRILIPLLLAVVLQALVLLGILYYRGVFDNLNQASLELLSERAQNKKQQLWNSMIGDWSELEVTEHAIHELVRDELQEQGKDWEAIKTDSELNAAIAEKATVELLSCLRNNKVTGIYLILDGMGVEDEADSYAGVYIRDMDPHANNRDNSDLFILRGRSSISRQTEIPLHSFWKASFYFKGGEENAENDFFFHPLQAAKASNITESTYFGYWSPMFTFGDENDVPIITYSIPLINAEGLVYGVLGIDISESYLTSQINYERFGIREDCFYYLGITSDGGRSFQKVVSSGDLFNLGDFSSKQDPMIDDDAYLVTSNRQGEVIHGYMAELKLYNDNTPFIANQWVLVGLQQESTLFQTTASTKRIIWIATGISLLLGIVIAILAGNNVVKPIMRLARGVRENETAEMIELPKAGIKEIDELAEAIEIRNQEVLGAALRTSSMIEHSGLPVGVYEVRKDSNRVYCSDGFLNLLDCRDACIKENQISTLSLERILHWATAKPYGEDVYELRKGEKKIYLRLVSQTDENGTIGAVLDVTDEFRSRQRIEHERDFDALTGIWNRRAFEGKMDLLFGEHRAELGIGAVVMLDMDNLKFINDAYGHDCGDEYIRTFAKALEEGKNEHVLYARRSGDEFYLFYYGYQTQEEVYADIHNCWERINAKSLVLPDESIHRIRASAGVAWYPKDAEIPSKLIHYADFAMYQVKHSQKGTMQEFDEKQYRENSFLFNGQEALNRLIDKQLVHFMFQPIFEVRTARVFGYEMLMRSNIEDLRTPDVILRLAKAQGKLHYIEKVTWYQSLAEARALIEQGTISPDSYLFINSIANQTLFKEEEEWVVSHYSDMLNHLVLEVTESEDNNMDYTKRKLAFMKEHDGMVAIDDYGTGYNSELALVMIPSDIVKIDISLVRNVDQDEDKQILIQNLISYAKKRHIAVLAEGIETYAEMKLLAQYGVDFMQGYYLAKPNFVPGTLPDHVKEELIALREEQGSEANGR